MLCGALCCQQGLEGGDRGHYASKYVERRDSVPVWCMVCTVLAAGTAPLSGQCSKLPRAGVILPQIIPQGMWGPEYVKIEII